MIICLQDPNSHNLEYKAYFDQINISRIQAKILIGGSVAGSLEVEKIGNSKTQFFFLCDLYLCSSCVW